MNESDRCDRCGAQAYTAWWHPLSKSLLTFCAHHTKPNELSLIADGFELTIDDRDRLLAQPEPA